MGGGEIERGEATQIVAPPLTGLHDMLQRGEPLLDSRRDGPEHEDEGEVHVPDEGATEHPRLLVEAVHEAGDGMEEPGRREREMIQCLHGTAHGDRVGRQMGLLVWPGNG